MALIFDFKSIKSRFDILGFDYICTESPRSDVQNVAYGANTLEITLSMRTNRPSVWRIYELMDDTNDLIGAKNA